LEFDKDTTPVIQQATQTSGSGADFTILAQDNTSGAGGDLNLQAGDGSLGNFPGDVNINPGEGPTYTGNINLNTNVGPAGNGGGGDINLITRATTGTRAGNILLQTGGPSGGAGPGTITLQTGENTSGGDADISLLGGFTQNETGDAGSINIQGGSHYHGAGAVVQAQGGLGSPSTVGGGNLLLTAGDGYLTYDGGSVNITAGDGYEADGGNVTITAGISTTGIGSNGLIDIRVGSSQVLTLDGYTIDANTQRIENVVDPINPQDAATKAYVDGYIDISNEWSEILANGNTSDGTNVIVNGGSALLIGTGTVATTGDIRADDGFSLQVRNASTDVQAIGVSSGVVTIGEDTDALGIDLRVSSGNDIQAFVNTNPVLTLDGSTVDVHTQRIENVVDPVNPQDAATKN
jgi:hypothetical protein